MKVRLILSLLFSFNVCIGQALDTNSMERIIKGKDTFYVENPFAKQNDPQIKFERVQVQAPKFKGDLEQFIKENLRYPEDAMKKGIKGSVTLYIHINELGLLDEEPIILKWLYPSMDKEAIRLVKLMSAWDPATWKGIAVPFSRSLEIPFQ